LDFIDPFNDQIVKLMPTKPAVFPPVHCKSSLPLATSLPLAMQEGILTNYLPDRRLTISIRTLCVATDLPIMYNWMSQEYAGYLVERSNPPAELVESYACTLRSLHAQPFMGLVNDIPVCQLDVYKVREDAISLCYDALPGDYGLNVLLAPLVIQDHVLLLLQMWMEYFFTFPEVKRVVVDLEAGNDWLETLFTRAGFRFSAKVRLPYKDADLYTCSRG
jgi:acetyl CoA:N6-hydroxylysine acetyl transferase